MEAFIAHWNTLSESARQIIVVCVGTQLIMGGLMIGLLKAYDNRGKTWPMEEQMEESLEEQWSQEIG